MRKTFKLEDLECANCAAKMEAGIKKIDGVTYASVNFMMQKLTLEADDAIFASRVKEAQKVIKRIEPDCRILVK